MNVIRSVCMVFVVLGAAAIAETDTQVPTVDSTIAPAQINNAPSTITTTTDTPDSDIADNTPEPINSNITTEPASSLETTPPAAETEQTQKTMTPLSTPESASNLQVNIVNVSETFYQLKINKTDNTTTRKQVTEARPGQLIELVIHAKNSSDQAVKDIELINTVPSGPIVLKTETFTLDSTKGFYRISRNGETFFQADAGLPAEEIKYIQWVIFSMEPGEEFDFSYQLQIKN